MKKTFSLFFVSLLSILSNNYLNLNKISIIHLQSLLYKNLILIFLMPM